MMRYTILGCGSSGGVPNVLGFWGNCDPINPKNRRRRCALLVERIGENGITRVVIDTGADFREQMISAKVDHLDAVVISHEHADHTHGIDDVRQFVNTKTSERMKARMEAEGIEGSRQLYFEMMEQSRIDCHVGLSAYDALSHHFHYLFHYGEDSSYPPIMRLKRIDGSFEVQGAGGKIVFSPFSVPHGDIDAYGFAIEDLVYLPDVYDLTDEARRVIKNCSVFVVDCLQFRGHGTHTHYEKTMEWIRELTPKRSILTNLHHEIDYDVLQNMTAENVEPAFDGLVIER